MNRWTLWIAILCVSSQCGSFEVVPNHLAFETTRADGTEGESLRATLSLDRAARVDTYVEFEAFFTGRYFYDIEITTSSPVLIAEGERSATIDFVFIDDGLMEPNSDTLLLEITGTNNPNITLAETGLVYQAVLVDNDAFDIPSSGVKAYLTWDAGTPSYNDVNLDLILNYNRDGNIEPVVLSENTTGFEDVGLAGGAANGNYYFDIRYTGAEAGVGIVDATLVFAQADGFVTYIDLELTNTDMGNTLRVIQMNKQGEDFTYTYIE